MTQELVCLIIVSYLIIVFGICFTMARQIPKLIDAKLRSLDAERPVAQPVLTTPLAASQLSGFRQRASVTDHTTRTLDKVSFE